MEKNNAKVSNPLTMIAIFAGLAESISVGVLPFLDDPQNIADIIWFTTWFPFTLLVLFFLTLNFNHKVLYSPSDFADQSHFIELVQGGISSSFSSPDSSFSRIDGYLRPEGTPENSYDEARENELEQWLARNNDEPISIVLFLYSAELEDLRSRFIKDKGL